MKKFFALMLCFLLLFSLASCSDKKEKKDTDKKEEAMQTLTKEEEKTREQLGQESENKPTLSLDDIDMNQILDQIQDEVISEAVDEVFDGLGS